jgi:hypothetical protein
MRQASLKRVRKRKKEEAISYISSYQTLTADKIRKLIKLARSSKLRTLTLRLFPMTHRWTQQHRYVPSGGGGDKHSLRVGWRNMCELPWFFRYQFHVIYCVTLAYVLFLKNFWSTIHIVDSWFWRKFDRICWACAIFRWIPNEVEGIL